jgi:glycosyltransferase involved in cell wall biosynthesis
MKILIATGIYPPQIGGPATYSKLLFDELPKRGIEVSVSSFGDVIKKPKLIRHFLYFIDLIKKGYSVDVIYAQDPISVGVPVLMASFLLRKKYFLKIVGDYAWEQGVQRFGVVDSLDIFSMEHKKYHAQVRCLKWIEAYVANKAELIITPSNYLKKIISNWGIDPTKIDVIYNGFHCGEIIETRDFLRAKYSLVGTTIISVGRLVPWKGFEMLIEALPSVISKIADARLVIVGDGPDRQKLEQKVMELNLVERVLFTGKLEQRALFEYIKASDAFVLNTQYEGFSHQILEVMAIGVPIITTNVGGNPEAIEHGVTGVLVEFNDKTALLGNIINIIADSVNTKKIVERAKNRVIYFTDTRMLEEFILKCKKFVSKK